jgi:NAD(P)-dependent dehydrogenase (short-subunit alcohol dehydrogenase family)
MNLSGCAAIVTGGGSGLGAATAKALADKGAKVAVFDINEDAAKLVAAATGARAWRCDVADPNATETAIAEVLDALGPVRVLVNCAGIAIARRVVGRDGPCDLAEFEKIIRVNLIGAFNMMRLVGAPMTRQEPLAGGERGVIISTASVAAFEGQIGQAAYSASKGGVAALTLPVAREFAQFGVRVLAIAPGLFLTPLLGSLPEGAQQSLAAAIPFPSRLGDPVEFASLVVHCVENSYLNGEVIRLDGALRMAPR